MSLGTSKIANEIRGNIYYKPVQLLRTSAAGPTQVSTTVGTFFRQARILGYKTLAGTNNAAAVNIGWSAAAGEQPRAIAPGAEVVIDLPAGVKWDLFDLYLVVGTSGDGIVVIYT